MMRALFAFWLALLLGAVAPVQAAGFSTASIGGGALKSGSTWSVKGASATAANGAFVTPATVTAAGRQVTMPASASFAANAASFAVSAIRLNPAGLMVGLTAQWLLSKGLTWANNSWTKNVEGTEWAENNSGAYRSATPQQVAEQYCVGYLAPVYSMQPPSDSTMNFWCSNDSTQHSARRFCTGTMTQWSPSAPCPAAQESATEADFAAVGSGPIPDGAAQELARANVPIPVNEPMLAPTPQTFDYGSPYVDPVTGKTVQTKTKVTPAPTATDPLAVRIETFNVEVAPAPAPVPGEPVPVPKDEQPNDPCLDNPDRIGCMQGGEATEENLENYSVPFSVSPIAIGGAGACPPDPVLSVHGVTATLKLAPICDAAGWLRPLVLALAWLSAAMIISGAVRES